MNKEELRKLAKSDNIIIKYSGKTKIAWASFIAAIKAETIESYKMLFNYIGYELRADTSNKN